VAVREVDDLILFEKIVILKECDFQRKKMLPIIKADHLDSVDIYFRTMDVLTMKLFQRVSMESVTGQVCKQVFVKYLILHFSNFLKINNSKTMQAGGHLGLFLGVSVMTLLQAIIYLCVGIRQCCTQRSRWGAITRKRECVTRL
jgi:hypothetical protein